MTATVTNTDITGAGNNGIRLNGSQGTGSLSVTLTAINIDGTGDNGVRSTQATMTVTNLSVGIP